jgi:hypothetical protein
MALNFQAFIDDSYGPAGEYVLAGYIATAEAWTLFAREWEQLLPFAILRDDGTYHFKMSEMAKSDERLSRVPAFYRVIEKHVTLAISARISTGEFERAKREAVNWGATLNLNVSLGDFEKPYFMAFRGLLNVFHSQRALQDKIPLDEKVDFIFDDQTEKGPILAAWDDYMINVGPEIASTYGAKPRFENDSQFLPLQAADLWAWWVREWFEEDSSPEPQKLMAPLDFGNWKANVIIPRIVISVSEADMITFFKGVIIEQLALRNRGH